MALVWMLKGRKKGQFVPVTESEAEKLVAEGKAQMSLTPPHLMRQPEYSTREMRPRRKRKSVDGTA